MIFDKLEHKELVLEILNSSGITLPLAHVELAAELKKAVREAEIAASPAPAEEE